MLLLLLRHLSTNLFRSSLWLFGRQCLLCLPMSAATWSLTSSRNSFPVWTLSVCMFYVFFTLCNICSFDVLSANLILSIVRWDQMCLSVCVQSFQSTYANIQTANVSFTHALNATQRMSSVPTVSIVICFLTGCRNHLSFFDRMTHKQLFVSFIFVRFVLLYWINL